MGKRVVITRPEAQAAGFKAALEAAGANPILFPTIAIAPIPGNAALDAALARLAAERAAYDWVVFTSVNGVEVVFDRMAELGLTPSLFDGCRVAVIGPATAAALSERGVEPSLVPESYVAEGIVAALSARGEIAGRSFLLLRATIARAALRDLLREGGATVKEVPVYETVLGRPEPDAYTALRAGVDVLTFTSSSTVRSFCELLGEEAFAIARAATVACIGPLTEETARACGLRVDVVAEEYTVPGLLAALEENANR
jgi:uroporphyrinogen-III synthase